MYPECLAAHGVEVRELDEVVVRDVGRVASRSAKRFHDLSPELFLGGWVLSQEVEDTRERIRRRIHAREDERPFGECLVTTRATVNIRDGLRRLCENLLIRHLFLLFRRHVRLDCISHIVSVRGSG